MNTKIFSRLGRRFAKITAAMTLAFGLATPALADFQGGGSLYAYTNCGAAPWFSGADPVTFRYRPSERSGGAASELSGYWPAGSAFNIRAYRGFDPTRQWFRSTGDGIHGGVFRWDPRPRVKILDRTVLSPEGASFETADIIYMRLRVRHFEGAPNCTADMAMMLHWQ